MKSVSMAAVNSQPRAACSSARSCTADNIPAEFPSSSGTAKNTRLPAIFSGCREKCSTITIKEATPVFMSNIPRPNSQSGDRISDSAGSLNFVACASFSFKAAGSVARSCNPP